MAKTPRPTDGSYIASLIQNSSSFVDINEGRNYVLNSNFDVWQRGTSFNSLASGSFYADRWRTDYNGTAGTYSVSRQSAAGSGLGATEPTYFLRWDQTVAPTGDSFRVLNTKMEGVRNMAGKSATLSFWAKGNANRVMAIELQQNMGTGGSPSVGTSQVLTFNLTTTWTKHTLTWAVPTVSGKVLGTNNNDNIAFNFYLPTNSVFTFDIAQIMFNEGTVAAPHQLAGLTLQGELAMCQRFYETLSGNLRVSGLCQPSLQHHQHYYYKVTKRAVPTIPTITGSNVTNASLAFTIIHINYDCVVFTKGADNGSNPYTSYDLTALVIDAEL